ncbi:MAG: hypothetical protein N2508_06495 [Anaerolineae bacterium]|nr:hypothetical protein [Anaerolineae bacterium]
MSIWMRLWFALLIIADRLLGTHLVEREMNRLQRRIGYLEERADALRRQMRELDQLLHVVQVEMCVLCLRQRQLLRPDDWLRFTPSESAEEEKLLDVMIERLVKHGLSTVRVETMGENVYVYYLHPDWDAIVALLSAWRDKLDPVTIQWLDEVR